VVAVDTLFAGALAGVAKIHLQPNLHCYSLHA